MNYLREQIAIALGISSSELNVEEPLNQMGLESLMVVELRNRLRAELEINIAIANFLDGVSVRGLSELVSAQILDVKFISQPPVLSTVTSNQNNWIEGEI